jgi:hypothetical protein
VDISAAMSAHILSQVLTALSLQHNGSCCIGVKIYDESHGELGAD